jgi:hypothetical protein
MQYGPSNLLWAEPTHYSATMIGFPYDDLNTWRTVYPPDVFVSQFRKVADGFDQALDEMRYTYQHSEATDEQRAALRGDIDLAEAATLHFRSTANQARFVTLRQSLKPGISRQEAESSITEIGHILDEEIAIARSLCALQCRDSRIGFEASNQYYYVPQDLIEKVLNCADLRDNWLPEQRKRYGL